MQYLTDKTIVCKVMSYQIPFAKNEFGKQHSCVFVYIAPKSYVICWAREIQNIPRSFTYKKVYRKQQAMGERENNYGVGGFLSIAFLLGNTLVFGFQSGGKKEYK